MLFQKTVTWKEFLGLRDCCSVCPKHWHKLQAPSMLPTLQTWVTYFGLWLSWAPDLFVRQFVVHRAEAVRIHPGAAANTGWDMVSRQWQTLGTRHSLAELELLAGFGCLPWPSCSSGAGAEQVLLGLSLLVSAFVDILQWLNVFSSVTGGCVSFSRRMFVPWWKGSGLPWGTGLGAASCLQLHPILAVWWENPGKNTATGTRRRNSAGSLSTWRLSCGTSILPFQGRDFTHRP